MTIHYMSLFIGGNFPPITGALCYDWPVQHGPDIGTPTKAEPRRPNVWQPEPLELPIESEPPQQRRPDGDSHGDLPGSHVIVIDIA